MCSSDLGGGSVLREKNRICLKRDSLVVFLNPDLDVQVRRTALDRKRPLLQGQDRRAVLTEMRASRYPLYREIAHMEIAVDNRPGKKMTNVIVNLMDKKGWITLGT